MEPFTLDARIQHPLRGVVGLVGAGGIGMELNKSMELASGFQKVTAILLCILGIVVVLDLLGQAIRHWFF